MKTALLSILLVTGLMGYSQRGPHHAGMKDMSADQVASIKTKKLTLALDLSEKQQQEIQEIHLEQAMERQTRREEGRNRDSKPDADERYAMINERLDRQIEMKEKMKGILGKEQFEKWEKLAATKEMRGRCKVRKGK